MSREVHVRFCEGLGVRFPRATRPVVHCRSLAEAENLLRALEKRFEACGLQLHPEKTRIVSCKVGRRTGSHEHEKFNFLGFCFRPRRARSRKGDHFVGFLPAISPEASRELRAEIRSWKLNSLSHLDMEQISSLFNAKIQGWINYYGRFYGSELQKKVLRYLNSVLCKWAAKKYKRLQRSPRQARRWLQRIFLKEPNLWAHWKLGVGMYG